MLEASGPDSKVQHTVQVGVSLPDVLQQQQQQHGASPVIAATPGRCQLRVDAVQAAASQGAVERLVAAALSDSSEVSQDCVLLTSIVVTPADLLA